MSTEIIEQFKKTLKIESEIIGVKFTKNLVSDCKFYHDTACTALARAIIKKTKVIFDSKKFPQLCEGANYFLKLSKIKDSEASNIYVKKEQIFINEKICKIFLESLPKFPNTLKNKFIIISPLKAKDKPHIVILLVNPAQAGRILGLLNYNQYKTVEIHPNQPTCLSLFAPMVTKKPHINFIDYYDRYYQGRINEKNIWPETKMIISLKFQDFKKILNNLQKSSQGSFRPQLTPQQVDKL